MFDLNPKHEFLVGIDSDGCAFDTMELKHKECFIPNHINHWDLQGVSKYAREAGEFVNLYSKSRGINRFPALVEVLEWLRRRPEVKARGVKIEIPQSRLGGGGPETKRGHPARGEAGGKTRGPRRQTARAGGKGINESVAGMVRGVPPFPFVRESIQKLAAQADVIVVSATPQEALEREWEEHDLTQYVEAICGQEIGTKKESLGVASKYGAGKSLMIGDAPGDHKAAVANHTRFFPINPGDEEASWRRFYEEAIDRFLSGTFDEAYQQALLDDFNRYLPEKPPWPVDD